jgi:peptide/nickel transport system permease protein
MAEAPAAITHARRRRPLSWRLILSGSWLLVIIACAMFAPLIAPHDPLAQDLLLGRLPPFWVSGAEPGYYLGTDGLGRDVLSRIIYGSRIALTVAFVAATAACLVGSAMGLIAGYFRGWIDQIVSRIVDIPPVLFSILLVAVLGTGLHSVIIAIAAIDWIRFCRVVRAETLVQTRMDYVDSARAAGFSRLDILAREVFPNTLPTILALLSLEMGIAVIVEAILSFVNLSISTDDPTWGGMIAEGRTIIHFGWWVLVFPLIALFLTVLAFSQFGEGLKDRLDPVLR